MSSDNISTTPTVTGSTDDNVRNVDLEKNQGTTVVVPASPSTRSPTLVDRHEKRLWTWFQKNRPAFLLFTIFILVNALWLVWLYYAVQVKVRPYDFRSLVNNKHAFNAFGVLLIIVGFFLGSLNLFVPVALFTLAGALRSKMCVGETSPRSSRPAIRHGLKKAFSICFNTLVGLVLISISAVAVVGPYALSFVAPPLAWKGIFRESCDGFGMRVWLDSKANTPAKSVEFRQFEPTFTYRMQFRPDPQESNDFYNVFSLDPGYIPGSSPVMPTYDSIHYNLTDQTYATKLKDAVIHRGTFQLHPRFRLPDLEIEAELEDFTRDEVYAPFVKVYSTTANDDILDQRRAWSDNTDVMMRAAKFTPGGHLQICARTVSDPGRSLGPLTPIPVGLLVLARAERQIAKPKDTTY